MPFFLLISQWLKLFPVGTKNIDFSYVSTFGSIPFNWICIRIQAVLLKMDPDSDPGYTTKNWKSVQLKKICTVQYSFYDQKLLQKKPPALQRDHLALQKRKKWRNFMFWTIFSWLDPDLNSKSESSHPLTYWIWIRRIRNQCKKEIKLLSTSKKEHAEDNKLCLFPLSFYALLHWGESGYHFKNIPIFFLSLTILFNLPRK